MKKEVVIMISNCARIISKIGLIAIVVGFFLPVFYSLDAFQLSTMFALASEIKTYFIIFSILIWVTFIVAFLGIILLVFNIMGKFFNFGYDCFVTFIPTLFIIILFCTLFNVNSAFYELQSLLLQFGFNNSNFNEMWKGGITIIIGLYINFIFFIIAAFLYDYDPKVKKEVLVNI